MAEKMLEAIINAKQWVQEANPLIHQITNYVSVNDCANITLAIGASPIMAQDINETVAMVTQAKALVINFGTLQSNNVAAMFAAGRRAKQLSIPIIVDPVGVGATEWRTAIVRRFIEEITPSIIRCNMSELKVLCGMATKVKGVDSAAENTGGAMAAVELACKLNGVVAVTGAVDIISDGTELLQINNGHPLLTRITGSGCMTTALTACFAAGASPFVGAAAGVLCMGLAGEIAAQSLTASEGVGTFKVRLMDAIFRLDRALIKKHAKIALKGAL